MFYEIKPEELTQIEEFANEQRPDISNDALTNFNNLYWALQRQLGKKMKALESKNASLQNRLERLKNKEEKKASEGAFLERDVDSVDVARVILFYLQNTMKNVNRSKVNAILYEMYSTWLAQNHERLFIEHPKATQYGPQFWRAYNHTDINKLVRYDDIKDFAEKNTDIMAFAKNTTNKYRDVPVKTMNARFINSIAFKNATPDEKKGEKWTKELSDADIYKWKKSI